MPRAQKKVPCTACSHGVVVHQYKVCDYELYASVRQAKRGPFKFTCLLGRPCPTEGVQRAAYLVQHGRRPSVLDPKPGRPKFPLTAPAKVQAQWLLDNEHAVPCSLCGATGKLRMHEAVAFALTNQEQHG